MGSKSTPGFYVIKHKPSGHYYGGSTHSVIQRIGRHKSFLTRREHPNEKLQSIFTSWEDITITVTATDDLEEAQRLEQEFINEHLNKELCCNVGTGSSSVWAKGKMPEHMKDKIRKANTGRILSDEHKRKIVESFKNSTGYVNARIAAREACGKKVSIRGVVYPSVKDASVKLGHTRPTITRRINSGNPKYSNWFWVAG
jgi:predicted GIY-YIG superfamily endonuclease